MEKPKPTRGLHHVALLVKNLEACEDFYHHLLGFTIQWRPDVDNVYLTSGNDNLALHRAPADFAPSKHQTLHHMGLFLAEKADVDEWYDYLKSEKVPIKAVPKDHRDGTRSFYVADPDGNIVQLIYYPLT